MCCVFPPLNTGRRRGGGTREEREDSLYSKTDRVKSRRQSQAYKGSEELHARIESGSGKITSAV